MPDAGQRKTVLITGAGGVVGTVLRRRLAGRYDLRLLSHRPLKDAVPGERTIVADIVVFDALRRAFDGVDAVVHLAAAASPKSTWDDVLSPNIIGAYNVYEAARQTGVPRVVFASSTHAVGMHYRTARESGYALAEDERIDERAEIRPDSFYGVSKAFGEILGRFYHDEHELAVICLRIGFVGPSGDEHFRTRRTAPRSPGEDPDMIAAIWLSHRDCEQLVVRSIETDVSWAVVYGTSDNARQVWDLGSARRLLGYQPEDRAPE